MRRGLPGIGGVRDPGTSSAWRRIRELLSIWDLVASRMRGGIQDLGQHPVPGGIQDPGGLLVPCWASSTQHHPGSREHPVPLENPVPSWTLGTWKHLGSPERTWDLVGHLGLGATWDLGVHPRLGRHPISSSIPYLEHPVPGASASCCPPLAAGDTGPCSHPKPLGSPLGLAEPRKQQSPVEGTGRVLWQAERPLSPIPPQP